MFSRISGLLISPGLIYRREAMHPTCKRGQANISHPLGSPLDICLPAREEGNTTVPRFSLIYRSSRWYLTKRSRIFSMLVAQAATIDPLAARKLHEDTSGSHTTSNHPSSYFFRDRYELSDESLTPCYDSSKYLIQRCLQGFPTIL